MQKEGVTGMLMPVVKAMRKEGVTEMLMPVVKGLVVG